MEMLVRSKSVQCRAIRSQSMTLSPNNESMWQYRVFASGR